MKRGSNVRSAFALMIMMALFVVLSIGKLAAQPFIAWNVAGSGMYGSADGLGTAAQFARPQGIAFDNIGNLYVADTENHRIRKIDRFGHVTTVAGAVQGYQDGLASQAQFRFPSGVAVDATGNIYVADNGNHRIRKITPTNIVTTIAGGHAGDLSVGSASQLTFPYYLVLDADGNIYVTDNGNYRIRKITPTGTMTTLAGSGLQGRTNGQGSSAQFWNPRGIIIDASGNLYVADGAIRKITPSGAVTTTLGDSTSEYTNVIFDTQNNLVGYRNVDNIGQVITDPTGSRIFANANTNTIQRLAYYSGLYLITEVIPTSAKAGETVTIKGFGLASTTGIFFGGIPAQSFQIISDNEIRAVVPVGGSGALSVQTSSGQSSVNVFKYLPPPIIISFQPSIAAANTPITINGSGFIGLQSISIGGVPVQSYTVVSPTQITVVLGSNAVSGDVSVVTEIDSTSKSGFTFVAPPTITTFSPNTAAIQGDTIRIQGRKLTGVTSVTFGGNPAQAFTVQNDSVITAIVGSGASGAVSVTNLAGTASRNGFTFIVPPSIVSFTPTNAGNGVSVTITGSGFTGVSAVSFGGVPAQSFTVQSPTQISAVVASGAGGAVRVENRAGASTQAGFTFYLSPVITGFSPNSAQVGQTIIINGRNFTGATQVQFGGTNAQSFTVVNDTTVQAVVGAGNTGNVSISNIGATGSLAGFSYLFAPTSFSAESPSPNALRGQAYSAYMFVANGFPNPTYTLASGALPSGLILSTTGIISGTPTTTGTFTFSVLATNNLGSVSTVSLTLIVSNPNQAPTGFIAQNPPIGLRGVSYSYTFTADGYPAPTYSLRSFSYLPSGLTLASNGVLSGIPLSVGQHTFSVQAQNNFGVIYSTEQIIQINGAHTNFVLQTPSTSIVVGTQYPAYTFYANGGYPSDSTLYSINGTLPPGLTLSTDGILSGSPTTTGTYTFNVLANNVIASLSSSPITITVSDAIIAPTIFLAKTPSSTGTIGVPYSYRFIANGSPSPTYSMEYQSIPGITLSPDGLLSGTPDYIGDFTISVRAMNTGGIISTGYIPIKIGQRPTFNAYSTSDTYFVGQSVYNISWTTRGWPRPIFSVASGTIPPGLTFGNQGGQGYLSGTVITPGTYTFIVKAENVAGIEYTNPITLTVFPQTKIYESASVTTLAGNGTFGYADGTGTSSQFGFPHDVAVDASGNLYVADNANKRIRKIATNGVVTTLAGSGIYGYADGSALQAQFTTPSGIAVDIAGNIYVAEGHQSHRIRKISPSGDVSTLAGNGSPGLVDGMGTAAQFYSPKGLAVDVLGNVYVADLNNSRIRKITPDGNVTTLAQVTNPSGVAVDMGGNVYVAGGFTISKIKPNGEILTLVGGNQTSYYNDGAGTLARFSFTNALAIDLSGNLYVADGGNRCIRKINSNNDVTTLAGNGNVGYNDGAGNVASFRNPYGVAVDAAGNVYVADQTNNAIRKISPITITQAPSVFTAQTPATSSAIGTAFTSYTFIANGSPAPTFTLASGSLPTGLTLSTAGILSGTPTAMGTYTFTVQATNSEGSIISSAVTITITSANQAPSAFSAQSPATSGAVGTSFASYTFVANGTPTPTYSVASGTLPIGLTLSSAGVLSGTPTAAGSYTFTVQASNSAGNVNSAPITIMVNQVPSVFNTQTPTTSGVVGTAYASYTFIANGTPAPTYSIASGTLPTGLTLSSAGVLSGTPTVAGSYTFAIQASNSAGSINSSPITITVTQAPSAFSAQAPGTSGVVGTTYTPYTFVANGSPAPTYSVASGTLPTGLTLSSAGVLSGTPTVAGSHTFTVQASNGVGSVNSASITITVTQPTTTISSFVPASATVGNTVTIRGVGFTGASVVRFGGTAAMGFAVASDTVITARVGTGASGAVSVTTPLGTASLAGFLYNVPPAPVAGSFSPTSARPGDTVVIRGVNFLSASTVSFGGVSMLYTIVSDTVIRAYISASAVSGAVNVITQGGTSNLNGFTFIPLPPAPRITSFTPNRAAQGASVVITGTNLTGATRVKFGAFDVASFTVNSATQITAVVGAGSSGAVSVQTAGGTFSLNGFTFVPPAATLSGFMPTSAAIGQTVVITGTNLSSALAVEFGGRSAVFTVNSDSQITATVPAGAASGSVSVTTLAGAASLAGFTFLAPPVVSSFSPTSAGVGASVVIAGSNFSGADTVRIGGVVASFVVNSASQITATVPSGAASGSVSVRTPYGTSSLAGFVFIPSPAITSFSPAVAGAGDVVTINGTNFTGASAVSFGGVPAASFTVVSATRITAAPSASGASGDISVATLNGTGTRSGFSFAGVPVITAFSPTGATGGDTVTISGTGFVGVSALTFGNTAVTSFTIVSPTEIKAIVSPRGSTGAVRLVTPGGTASLNGFTFTAPLPVITGFSPASATVEQTVTITGRNFAGDLYSTLAVSFGGRAAGRFTVVNDSTITAAVGGGATGSVSVRTPGGTANRAGFTFIPAAPIITGFTPASAPAGATITISGNNFFAASAVRFGGIAGTSLVVVNDSTVTVRVAAAGATGVVTLTTPSGTATSASAFTFIPAPVISAFAPASASVGDTVSIAGTGFTGATAVRFGGTAALRFTVVSDSEIQAVVNGGSTGAVTVVSPNGTGTLSGFTYLPPAPRITSFTPATAAAGTSVVINGNYFTGATAVNFGGIAATSFVINSATRITAVVAAGSASGAVTVTSPNGTGTLAGFTFLAAPPAIASFSPTSAPAGGTVLIRGTGFMGATAVRFGGIAAASFARTGDTLISARVSASGASGDVSVVSVAGTGTLSGFVFIPAPSISSFTPTSAAQGDTVTIAGANFLGTTAVSFGGAAANIVSVNATQIVVLVGSGASGSLSLTTPGGSASKTGFTYLPPGPRITGFTPATATPGTSVVISGSSFTGASSVSFGGIAAASFVVNSATRITAVVPVGGLSGDVSVTTPLGTAAMAGFTFTPVPAPVITSFTPTTMPNGSTTTTMTINGRNFTGATAVSVGGVAVPFTIVSATRITARLTGAIGGAVSVTTPGGTATMAGFVLTSLFDMKSWDNLTSSSNSSNPEELNVVTGVSNLDAPPLTAFPNPASESVTLTGSGFAEGRLVSLTLINTLGQTVLTLTQQPIGGNLQANVDVRQVPSGAYTAVLSDGVVQRAVRFVKR